MSEQENQDEYAFSKCLRRLSFKRQLPYIFDRKEYQKIGQNSYIGEIEGIQAKVTHKINYRYTISAKSEQELKLVHFKALRRILDYDRKNGEFF
jgi:hypothetical protein